MKTILLSALLLCTLAGSSQGLLNKAKDKANSITKGKSSGTGLSNEQVVKGLKEALSIGADNSSTLASKADGFYKNPEIFIPWPAEAQAMKDKLIKMGFQNKVTEFETSLNRAAEEAAKDAAPIFKDAVTGMSVGDGFAILKGNDTAATHYLREKTYSPLKEKFTPVVKTAIEKVKVTAYWSSLVTIYNKMPGAKKQDPDLNNYVTEKAINGLMTLIGKEEAKIRNNPAAQVTDLLKDVFGKK
ncbi:MAG: hypothetical protein K0S33_4069 [Bacteroidetes bacterium]|jgi:hypothetical protein|nr:hypothetical protein [Bacteroidota bacterium]